MYKGGSKVYEQQHNCSRISSLKIFALHISEKRHGT